MELATTGLLQGPIGSLVKVRAHSDTHQVVAGGLFAPYGVAIRGHDAYVTTGSVVAGHHRVGVGVRVHLDERADGPLQQAVGSELHRVELAVAGEGQGRDVRQARRPRLRLLSRNDTPDRRGALLEGESDELRDVPGPVRSLDDVRRDGIRRRGRRA